VKQILLYEALQFAPPQFAHLSMVMGEDNTRLSKRHGATSVYQFKQEGYLSSALFNYLALLGWAPSGDREVLSREEIIDSFDIHKVSRSAAVFDYDKLHWISRQHIKNLSGREIAEKASELLKISGFLPKKINREQRRWLEKAAPELIKGVSRFSEIPDKFSIFFDFSPEKMSGEARKVLKTECGKAVVRALSEKLDQEQRMSFEMLSSLSREIKKETGCKGKDLFHPIRVALTAQVSGLDLDTFIPLVEEGSHLSFSASIKNCAQRAAETARFIQGI
jgi:glutamyl/glutaminyl-tRNA synthetase